MSAFKRFYKNQMLNIVLVALLMYDAYIVFICLTDGSNSKDKYKSCNAIVVKLISIRGRTYSLTKRIPCPRVYGRYLRDQRYDTYK